MRYLLSPGDLAADLAGLPAQGEHRQILRMFINTVVFGMLGVAVVLITLA